jgi:hypothetical protein
MVIYRLSHCRCVTINTMQSLFLDLPFTNIAVIYSTVVLCSYLRGVGTSRCKSYFKLADRFGASKKEDPGPED